MKLYAVVGSNNSRKVLAVAKHLEFELDVEFLDFFGADLKTPEYLAINPNGKVPCLVDGDFRLWESNAIMIYLASIAPENALYPGDVRRRADIHRWLNWELAHFNQSFGSLVWESVAKPQFLGQSADPDLVAAATAGLERFAPVLDAHMRDRRYALGDEITLADYGLIHIEWFKEIVPFDWSGYAHLNAYFERMRQVPHWAATAPASPEAIGHRPEESMAG